MSAAETKFTHPFIDEFEPAFSPAPLTHTIADIAPWMHVVRVAVLADEGVTFGFTGEKSDNPKKRNRHELLGGQLDEEDYERADGDFDLVVIGAGTREAYEESGEIVEPIGVPVVVDMRRIPDTPEEGCHAGKFVVTYGMRARPVDGVLRAGDEHEAVGRMHPEVSIGNPTFRTGTAETLQLLGVLSLHR